ncbi:MAG: carbohydrate kinase family protein, partial [Bacteroidota bacterium]
MPIVEKSALQAAFHVGFARRQKPDVVVFGLLVADILGRPVDLRRLPKRGSLQMIETISFSTGGNAANVGIALRKLGMKVGVIGRLGNDVWRTLIIDSLKKHGIESTHIASGETPQTSATIVCVDAGGERSFLHTPGASRDLRGEDLLSRLKYISRAKLLMVGYLGLLPQMENDLPEIFQRMKKETYVLIALDTGGIPRRNRRLAKAFLPYVDFFIPSLNEAQNLTGFSSARDIMKFFRDCGAPNVVGLKLGKKGCLIADQYGEYHVPGFPVKRVVDATGAGDSFFAGFLAAWLRGLDTYHAAEFANMVGACCVSGIGASTGIRSFEETQQL